MTAFVVRIESIATGGDGVARHDGRVVFVPRTAPGDEASVSAVAQGRLMRGQLVSLHAPGPGRVQPPCEHYTGDRCGGCQLQHLEYSHQLRAKSLIIRDALNRIGGLAVDPPDVMPSAQEWRYRRKLTLTLRWSGEGDRWTAGLRRFDAPGEVFDLRDCPITTEEVMDAWRGVLGQTALLPRVPELRGAVRAMTRGFSFTLEGGSAWPRHQEFREALPWMQELWWVPEGKSRRLLWSRPASEGAGASFVQVNPVVASELREWVVSLAALQNPATAIDAYAGTGDFAAALAARGTRVTAIERDRDAARACAARLPAGSTTIAEPVERAIRRVLPADLVVLNPPRAGLHESVADALRNGQPRPRRLIYVSCDPATLARDLRRLGGFQLRSVRGFDMFPQTAHVETVCELDGAE